MSLSRSCMSQSRSTYEIHCSMDPLCGSYVSFLEMAPHSHLNFLDEILSPRSPLLITLVTISFALIF